MSIADPIRKNLLDLSYQRYNSLLNTTIVVLVAIVGILMAAFTAIVLSEKFDRLEITTVTTIIFFGIILTGFLVIYYLDNQLKNIKEELRKIREEVR